MFSKLKQKISEKTRVLKKAAFLALVSYLYDLVERRGKKKKNITYVENVEYETKDRNNKT